MTAEEGWLRELQRVVACFGVSQSFCWNLARMAVSLSVFGCVQNHNRGLWWGVRGGTRVRAREIIFARESMVDRSSGFMSKFGFRTSMGKYLFITYRLSLSGKS